jgi:SAM-dependent methyltransferase
MSIRAGPGLFFDRSNILCYHILQLVAITSICSNFMLTNLTWAEEWASRITRSNLKTRLQARGVSSEEFWDSFTGWQQLHSYTKYPGQALDRILGCVDSKSTVLDIGAGNGAISVPLAKAVRHVTAVEPSSGQVSRLMENAGRAGVGNIRVIPKRWEDTTLHELGCHDVVTAAYCFQMTDIRAALEKMYAAATKNLFLLHFVDHDLVEPLRNILGGMEPGPDYLCLYNVIDEMGYLASLEVFTRDYEIPLDFQLEMLTYTHGLSSEDKERLVAFLASTGRLCSRDGMVWARRQYRDALIMLSKGGGNGV